LAFFGMLIIGILAGYIAEKVTTSDQDLLTNLLAASPAPSLAACWLHS